MENSIDADIIKATQTSLGKYVKRPPLSDKLLKKPPFRFLHDIITSVLKTTGFFNGLFEDAELVSDNVKDRESKILFLTKVISVIGNTTRKTLSVKPSKIVAGQEPEKTNELLQSLALALDNKLSSDEAVKLYRQSENTNTSGDKKVKNTAKPIKKATDTKKIIPKTNEKLVKTEKNPSKTKLRENSTVKKDSPPKKTSNTSKVTDKKVTEKEKQDIKIISKPLDNINVVAKQESKHDSLESLNSNITPNLEITNENKNSEILNSNNEQIKEDNEDCQNLVQEDALISEDKILNASLETNTQVTTNDETNENNKQDINEQLSTEYEKENTYNKLNKGALPQLKQEANTRYSEPEVNEAGKKVVDKIVERPNSVRPSSSRPGAPIFRDKHELLSSVVDNLVGKVNIIAESTTHEEEEESSIVIVENTETLSNLQNEDDQLQTSSNRHGHLVQQILNAQKEFSEVNGKTNIEWQFGAQKARDLVNHEIEQIRFNVQALSRVANPLGKLLDHIQEDVEVMRQELQQWTKSYDEASKQLLKQKAANEESLIPLHSKIKQLEAETTEKYDKINDLKIVIHKNALRIEKLLVSGNVQ